MKNDTIKLLLIFTPALFGSFPALANVITLVFILCILYILLACTFTLGVVPDVGLSLYHN